MRIARLAALSALAKGPGFLIPVVLAAFFGAGPSTDAYFLAYGGVLLVGGTVGQPLEAAIVPFAAHALALGRSVSESFGTVMLRLGASIGIGAAVLGALLIGVGLRISHPAGVEPTRVFGFYALLAPAAAAWCIAGLYSGAAVSGWKLEASALANGFRGLGALIGAVGGAIIHQLWPVAVGISAGECVRALVLRRYWTAMSAALPEGESGAPEKGVLHAASHQMLAQGLLSGAQFVERFIVGGVAVAAISHVEYANRLIAVATVIFDGGVAPWLLARWATQRVRSTLDVNWRNVYRPLAWSTGLAGIVAATLAGGAPIVVGLVLRHGSFSVADASVVTSLLRWYAVGYWFNMNALCVERLLLARAQNRLFAGLAAVRATIRIATVLAALPSLGIFALPLAYAFSEAVYLLLLLSMGTRRLGTVPA